MPKSKEEKNEQRRLYRLNNKELIKQRSAIYRLNNQEKIKEWRLENQDYNKQYFEKNKERLIENGRKRVAENPEACKKINTKSTWKHLGIICDFEEVYNHYINCHRCEYCDTEFKSSKDRCLDHDHSIIDRNNVRGVLCNQCNLTDVLDVDNLEFLTS